MFIGIRVFSSPVTAFIVSSLHLHLYSHLYLHLYSLHFPRLIDGNRLNLLPRVWRVRRFQRIQAADRDGSGFIDDKELQGAISLCREKQRKEASRLQAVNRKLTAMNKLLMEENDRLQKQVSQLVHENSYFRQHTHNPSLPAKDTSCESVTIIFQLFQITYFCSIIFSASHITRLWNKLVQLSDSNGLIKASLQENSEWNEWQSSVLQERNTVENVYRWACGRPTTVHDRTRDSDKEDRDYDVAALANNLSQAFNYRIYGTDDNEEDRNTLDRDDSMLTSTMNLLK